MMPTTQPGASGFVGVLNGISIPFQRLMQFFVDQFDMDLQYRSINTLRSATVWLEILA